MLLYNSFVLIPIFHLRQFLASLCHLSSSFLFFFLCKHFLFSCFIFIYLFCYVFQLVRFLIACVLFDLDVCFAFFAQCGCELKLFYDLGMLLFAVKFIYFLMHI